MNLSSLNGLLVHFEVIIKGKAQVYYHMLLVVVQIICFLCS
jgi:hypothetical protein